MTLLFPWEPGCFKEARWGRIQRQAKQGGQEPQGERQTRARRTGYATPRAEQGGETGLTGDPFPPRRPRGRGRPMALARCSGEVLPGPRASAAGRWQRQRRAVCSCRLSSLLCAECKTVPKPQPAWCAQRGGRLSKGTWVALTLRREDPRGAVATQPCSPGKGPGNPESSRGCGDSARGPLHGALRRGASCEGENSDLH